MDTNTYTEEEFKKVLKNLFAEKKRVKELQKQLGEKGLQKKFQTKLVDIHKLSLTEEYATLKSAFAAKEGECLDLRSKLEKVRPALKKLVDDLKAARGEIEILKNQKEISRDVELEARLSQAKEHIEELERQRQRLAYEKQKLEQDKERLEEENARLLEEEGEARVSQEQLLELEEQLNAQKQVCASVEEEKQRIESSLYETKKAFEEKERELERARANEQKEAHRFEAERSRLVERLAEGLSQVQRQADIIKDLREENSVLHREHESGTEKLKNCERQIFDLKEQQRALLEASEENERLKRKMAKLEEELGRERHAFSLQAKEWAQYEKQTEKLSRELDEARAQLGESDLASVCEEYEAKMAELEKQAQKAFDELTAERDRARNENAVLAEELRQAVEEKEKVLEKSYAKMRELSSKHAEMTAELEAASKRKHQLVHLEKECEERHAEIRKAHQHLAKKVKEATILRDLAERQKGQIIDLQNTLAGRENELERLQNSLDIHQMHEQKLQSMASERAQAAEALAKEWQEKYLNLQQDWQEKKAQLLELQKMRENYDQMTATVSSLKNILGKGEKN